MTSRNIYEAALIEMNKVEAPSMLLEDFNYYINKAIQLYINKLYNMYDVNLQMSDNMRVLKATAVLTPKVTNTYDKINAGNLYKGIVEFELPLDYLHILNCICNFKALKNYQCINKDEEIQYSANRLTSDMWALIINNYYMRPTYKRPYYFIHNVNTEEDLITNPIQVGNWLGTDPDDKSDNSTTQFPRTLTLNNDRSISTIEKEASIRYGNASPVRLEIRYGKDTSTFKLNKIYVDYIKTPQFIRLTQEQVDLTEDTSLIMEFPDYVCQEIINELVKLLMENVSDPRLLTNLPINQTIASPAPQSQTK